MLMRALTSLAVVIALVAGPSAFAGKPNPSAEVVQKIKDALPDKPPAKPKAKRRILVFSVTNGYRHRSIPVGQKMWQLMGEKTGAFEAVVSDELSNFEKEKLDTFDAVLFNNTTGDPFVPKKGATKEQIEQGKMYRENLEAFVKGGKALVGIHAATDTFYNWQGYGDMIGGYFCGHPWGAGTKVGVKAEDPDHPCTTCFEGKPIVMKEEIYQFADGGRFKEQPFSREKQRVLTVLDPKHTNMKQKGAKREDGDYAISWIKPHGKGRVFYCALGHNEHIYWHPVIVRHYLAGVQWALGDLEADATPIPYKPENPKTADDEKGGKDKPKAEKKDEAKAVEGKAPAYKPRYDKEGYEILFDGKDLNAWDYKKGGWVIDKDGALYRAGKAGFIWSKARYSDFVLDLEFKVAPRTNSGVFIRTDSRTNWLHTGIEVQVLDSAGKDKPGKHDAGAIYDIQAPSKNTMKKPGEWNRMIVTAKDNMISVELNGEKVNQIDLDRWTQAGRNPDGSKNKFRTAYKDLVRDGFIAFQDHGNPVWYRNVRVKRLEK